MVKRQKSERGGRENRAVLAVWRRKTEDVRFSVEGVAVSPKTCTKYLGVWIDGHLNFKEHMKSKAINAQACSNALYRLMPSVKGPRASKGRILCGVV